MFLDGRANSASKGRGKSRQILNRRSRIKRLFSRYSDEDEFFAQLPVPDYFAIVA